MKDAEADATETARQQIDGLLRQDLISADVHQQVIKALAASKTARPLAAPSVQPASAPQPPSDVPPSRTPKPIGDGTAMDWLIQRPDVPSSRMPQPSEQPVQAELVQPRQKLPAAPRQPEAPPVPASSEPAAPPSRVPESLQERADRYQQRRAAAAAEAAARPAPVLAPSEPPQPRQAWLASFMEEKHIRWGELVGGLMIVCSSIALVISFWAAIAERPLLKFGVLNGVTAALFGLGLYAARRWKLPTTSQGILITSTLLVPLNFLAIAAFSEGTTQLTLPVLAGEGLSTLLLGALVFQAAHIITPAWPITVTAGVLMPAVGQLLMRRHLDATSTTWNLYGFALAGLAVYLASQLPVLWSRRSREPLTESQGNELLKQLGLVSFSLFVALGLLLAKAGHPAERLQWLAPLSVLLAAPAMSCGLLLWKRPGVADQSLRMAGTTLAVVAACVAGAGLVLAWPQPVVLIGCGVLSCLGLTLLAWWYEVEEAHVLAAVLASVSGVLLLLLCGESLPWTVESPRELIGRYGLRPAERRSPWWRLCSWVSPAGCRPERAVWPPGAMLRWAR